MGGLIQLQPSRRPANTTVIPGLVSSQSSNLKVILFSMSFLASAPKGHIGSIMRLQNGQGINVSGYGYRVGLAAEDKVNVRRTWGLGPLTGL